MKRRHVISVFVFVVVSIVSAASMVAAARPATRGPGSWVELSFRLPAIGNVKQVREWQYGRIRSVARLGQDDLSIEIRSGWGQQRRVTCPREPFNDLARISSWMRSSNQQPSSSDVVERMVAFAADTNGRVIALVSLEPLPRDADQIARAAR